MCIVSLMMRADEKRFRLFSGKADLAGGNRRPMMIATELWHWAVFGAVVGAMLMVDIVVSSRLRRSGLRTAALWSMGWTGLGLLFGVWLGFQFGRDVGVTYLAAYLLEESLSIDNLFVFALVFSQLQIPPARQRRVLFWGILTALLFRALMIGVGVYLIQRFQWVIYPFAVLLLFAAVRLIFGEEKERKLVVESCAVCSTWIARFIPVTGVIHGDRFFVREAGRRVATPLFIALVVIETTDIVFALDSIPAVLGITRDPYLVYTSNVFAMVGLRSLYFVLASLIERFRYLRLGLAVILAFVAAKMLLEEWLHVSATMSLAVIASILGAAMLASLIIPATRPMRPN
jgi:tellurite resistance protein TerC